MSKERQEVEKEDEAFIINAHSTLVSITLSEDFIEPNPTKTQVSFLPRPSDVDWEKIRRRLFRVDSKNAGTVHP